MTTATKHPPKAGRASGAPPPRSPEDWPRRIADDRTPENMSAELLRVLGTLYKADGDRVGGSDWHDTPPGPLEQQLIDLELVIVGQSEYGESRRTRMLSAQGVRTYARLLSAWEAGYTWTPSLTPARMPHPASLFEGGMPCYDILEMPDEDGRQERWARTTEGLLRVDHLPYPGCLGTAVRDSRGSLEIEAELAGIPRTVEVGPRALAPRAVTRGTWEHADDGLAWLSTRLAVRRASLGAAAAAIPGDGTPRIRNLGDGRCGVYAGGTEARDPELFAVLPFVDDERVSEALERARLVDRWLDETLDAAAADGDR